MYHIQVKKIEKMCKIMHILISCDCPEGLDAIASYFQEFEPCYPVIKAMLKCFQNKDILTSKQVAQNMHLDINSTRIYLRSLANAGLLVCVKSGSQNLYYKARIFIKGIDPWEIQNYYYSRIQSGEKPQKAVKSCCQKFNISKEGINRCLYINK